MSNSQEQSLDENAVFHPLDSASPEFLHSERERQAVEHLLGSGPEAFYSAVGSAPPGCFLSPEEVGQMSSWARDFAPRPDQGAETRDSARFSSTYFPSCSDTPPPCLDLGWPEKTPGRRRDTVTVHTSPPAEGQPSVREVVRRYLQQARQVIAIVTDGLTDGTVIGDLHAAASRGVPVYVIVNARSVKENFTASRLRHPNIGVRVLGGKTFCSRSGRMVVGELKDRFLLVDLETVIHGSYSFTWTDAHLHRQLVTVLTGAVVDVFDNEFRVLFASSLPALEVWSSAASPAEVTWRHPVSSALGSPKPLPLRYQLAGPPSPPPDSLLDWDAMGVTRCLPGNLLEQGDGTTGKESPPPGAVDFLRFGGLHNGFETRRVYERSPVATKGTWLSRETETSPEVLQRVERAISRQLSKEKSSTSSDERGPPGTEGRGSERGSSPTQADGPWRKDRSGAAVPLVDNMPSSRKPVILRVPQSESFSSLSDIMKRLNPPRNPSSGASFSMSNLSQSMMDLSTSNPETAPELRRIPLPKLSGGAFNLELVTPALVLMKKRNDEVKSSLERPPKTFLPRERPRNTSYALNWRSLADRRAEQD